MKRLIRDEKGQVLVLALILALVGGLIVAPLLAYMGTGLITGEVYERRTDELYAADAGVEDAVWKIQNQAGGVEGLTKCNSWTAYNITDVNNKTVAVNITLVNNVTSTYQVVSTATGGDTGTEIEAYIASVYGNYSGIMDNVITSLHNIDLLGGPEISYPEENAPVDWYGGPWPPVNDLAAWYRRYVEGVASYDSDLLDLDGVDQEIGPFYRDGEVDELEIKNSSNTHATLTLTGTVYITVDTLIGTTGKDFTLDLNGQTIFVESASPNPQKALAIGGKCSIIGPGIIIAIGYVYFQPNIEAGMTDPIFIMSVSDKTWLQPGGDFYGAVAGDVEVEMKSGGGSLNYPVGGFPSGLNFPGCIGTEVIYGIDSWEVNQQ